MTRAAQEQALRKWVELVVVPLGFTPVIFSDAGGPRPIPPYATVRVISSLQSGALTTKNDYEAGPDELTERVRSTRVGTAAVQLFGDGHDSAAHDLMASLADQDVIDQNAVAGLTVIGSTSGIQRLSTDFDGVIEDHSLVEVDWSTTHERAKLRPYVLDIVIEETIDG